MSLEFFIIFFFGPKKKTKNSFPSFSPPSSCHLPKKVIRAKPLFADDLTNFHFDQFSVSPPSSCHLQIVVNIYIYKQLVSCLTETRSGRCKLVVHIGPRGHVKYYYNSHNHSYRKLQYKIWHLRPSSITRVKEKKPKF
jgi:hypothetical protein